MTNDEILQAAKEAGFSPNRSYTNIPITGYVTHDLSDQIKAFAATIEKRTIERCAVASWNHYMETCRNHGHGPDVESIRDFCSAAAIRKLGEQE